MRGEGTLTKKEGAELPGDHRGLAVASLWRAFSRWQRSWLLSATHPAFASYSETPSPGSVHCLLISF